MSSLRFLLVLLSMALWATSSPGQGLTALAQLDSKESRIEDRGDTTWITLRLSQPVPWRAYTAEGPRLVLEFAELQWTAVPGFAESRVTDLAAGERPGEGWSRMVLDVSGPVQITKAEMVTNALDGTAELSLALDPADPADFAATARALPAGPSPRPSARPGVGTGRLVVAIDPGHGGLDPGAEFEDLNEADLMLSFGRELREALLRTDRFDVVMTRELDEFVPLEKRLTRARLGGADVFVSLHADSLPPDAGVASGATVYTLAEDASDLASQRLAERHDRTDLLSGTDVDVPGDEIALVLMDIARTDTAPRSGALADALVDGLKSAVGRVNSRPRREAAFSVLKSPDMPSVLVELGFLSSERDRANLRTPEWRAKAAAGLRDGLIAWADADAVRATLLRR
ncbi:MAG: N-acetylmuramoyl-L-alanine amidase [Pseudomonadota bacterium]